MLERDVSGSQIPPYDHSNLTNPSAIAVEPCGKSFEPTFYELPSINLTSGFRAIIQACAKHVSVLMRGILLTIAIL